MAETTPAVVLFGYEASTFTIKARLALRIKQIPYIFITVPSMMPRPVLTDTFGLTYRKIPVLAIGKEVYCDTSLIVEALEHFFPESEGYQTMYPEAADGRSYRPMIRGFASYWTDRPLFRVTTGLIPASVWRTSFGQDRAGLIGHKLDAEKLEKKVPENLSRLDMQLSMLEPMFDNKDGPWIFSTSSPSLADISVYYQLSWGSDIAAGRLINNLTGGGTSDTDTEGATPVFNAQRYPGLYTWYTTLQRYLENLPSTENKDPPFSEVLEQIKKSPSLGPKSLLLPTPRSSHADLDGKCGLTEGALVSVAPDDTGRDNPTIGTLVAMSPEEVVIKPQALDKPAEVEARIHFPRLGFVTSKVIRHEALALFFWENDWTVHLAKHTRGPGFYARMGQGMVFTVENFQLGQEIRDNTPLFRRFRRFRIFGDRHLGKPRVVLKMVGGEPTVEHGSRCPFCASASWPKVLIHPQPSHEQMRILNDDYIAAEILHALSINTLNSWLLEGIAIAARGFSVRNLDDISVRLDGEALSFLRSQTGAVQAFKKKWRGLYLLPGPAE
ncbi:hypothetical protein LTR85_011333 [Meristemomyces frigidus]|nr:hypothetical protein LTR85_011333 [Meristemomyces frigidus]